MSLQENKKSASLFSSISEVVLKYFQNLKSNISNLYENEDINTNYQKGKESPRSAVNTENLNSYLNARQTLMMEIKPPVPANDSQRIKFAKKFSKMSDKKLSPSSNMDFETLLNVYKNGSPARPGLNNKIPPQMVR